MEKNNRNFCLNFFEYNNGNFDCIKRKIFDSNDKSNLINREDLIKMHKDLYLKNEDKINLKIERMRNDQISKMKNFLQEKRKSDCYIFNTEKIIKNNSFLFNLNSNKCNNDIYYSEDFLSENLKDINKINSLSKNIVFKKNNELLKKQIEEENLIRETIELINDDFLKKKYYFMEKHFPSFKSNHLKKLDYHQDKEPIFHYNARFKEDFHLLFCLEKEINNPKAGFILCENKDVNLPHSNDNREVLTFKNNQINLIDKDEANREDYNNIKIHFYKNEFSKNKLKDNKCNFTLNKDIKQKDFNNVKGRKTIYLNQIYKSQYNKNYCINQYFNESKDENFIRKKRRKNNNTEIQCFSNNQLPSKVWSPIFENSNKNENEKQILNFPENNKIDIDKGILILGSLNNFYKINTTFKEDLYLRMIYFYEKNVAEFNNKIKHDEDLIRVFFI